VTDLGNQNLTVQALGPGPANIVVSSLDGTWLGEKYLSVAVAAAITFADPSHLAAGIDGGVNLPPTFDILSSGSNETIQAVITDDAGQPLASSGLAMGTGTGIGVSPATVNGAEGFILQPLLASTATFVGSLSGVPSSALTYQITLVPASAVANTVIESRLDADGNIYVLAIAQDSYGNEIFGLGTWTFIPTGGATALPLAPAAAKVVLAEGTTPGSVTVTATNPSLSLTATAQLP
jgi:hypothetical protein